MLNKQRGFKMSFNDTLMKDALQYYLEGILLRGRVEILEIKKEGSMQDYMVHISFPDPAEEDTKPL